MTPGFATPDGTGRYAARFRELPEGHFRGQQDLLFSSIGIGTYLGNPDVTTDQGYTDAVVAAVCGGVNVIDSAINYRFQRSERSIGAALKRLWELGCARDELIVCTKGGYLTPDTEMPRDPSGYFLREYVEPGILRADEIVAGCHAMTPRYLESQLQRSRRNLGVECIDVYYLHNPETQLGVVSAREFRTRVRAAFEYLESAVAAGQVRRYGMATWNAFRQPETAGDYVPVGQMEILAREVAGEAHHFRCVQLPFNLAMTEALTRANQPLDSRTLPMIEAAHALDMTLIGSASLLQGRVARNLPAYLNEILGLENDVHRALQFARSAPGITTALVGMSRVDHVRFNLELLASPPTPIDRFSRLFEQRKPA